MANGGISRLSAYSNSQRDSQSDLDARIVDIEARNVAKNVMADVFSMATVSRETQKEVSSVPFEVPFSSVPFSSVPSDESKSIDIADIVCKVLGEFFGTSLLLLFACMGLIQWTQSEQPLFVGGLVFGLTIMFIIQVVGAVSGSHINPAVTLAALIYRKITIRMACFYVIAQFLGALLGFGVLTLLTPMSILRPEGSVGPGVCSPSPNPALTNAQVFFYEYFATTVLIAMCCAAWDPRNAKNQDSIPIKFGLATAIPFIAVSPATGCCINPARAFAPAVYNGDWNLHWAYWLAPLLAAVVTTTVYKALFHREAPPEEK